MVKLTVGVLRGGPSSEYDVSLKTGQSVLADFPHDKYRPLDIWVSKAGEWHAGGLVSAPEKILRSVDVVFNAMHGEYGEDGRVQRVLEMHGVPFTGSESWPSFLAMHKVMARETFKQAGLKIPAGMVVKKGYDSAEVTRRAVRDIGPAWVVKPARRGSSIGVSIVNGPDELPKALEKAFAEDSMVLVEKRVKGREATVAVLENFRGEKLYAFPAVEIVPPKNKFFDYEVKYNGATQEICPGRFDAKTKLALQEAAKLAHQALGCRHYSRSDFIVSKTGIYILETNTLPGLTSESLFPKAAASVGLRFPQLIEHLISIAV
ncbi:MAG: D-alanine--D-alanine ligase [Candidatus Niyogibacteria bacterium]|nr:D-alanine--D-alanine ligase [Candidatus Niyogibacteria bacterium]